MLKGLVFDIQRFSIHDGPGIRTTVFLKGCPLSCLWCHNPESQDAKPEVFFTPGKCIGCLFCVRMCERKCHRIENGVHVYDRQECVRCGRCVTECYPQALEVAGKPMTVEEALAEVMKDEPFYANSGGGLTVSGGEPMLQFQFTKELLESAKAKSVHTCLETCGCVSGNRMREVRPFVDVFLYDIKDTDAERHRAHTGVANGEILTNLRELDRAGAAIILRCPIIPGLNDRPDHFHGVGRLTYELPHVQGVEILPYHPLGTSKSARLGRKSALPDVATPAEDVVEEWLTAIRQGSRVPVRRS